MAEGIDRAAPFTTAAPLDCLRSNGITFIGRYYSNSDWKNLTRSEAQLISSRGLWIVTVYQDAANNPGYFTYERGVSDCSRAIQRATDVGQPTGTPIYFAVDFEVRAQDSRLANVERYFEGVQQRMRQYAQDNGGASWPLGIYGTYDAVTYIRDRVDDVTYIWLTYAWSRGRTLDEANLYQYSNDLKLDACRNAGTVDRVRSNGSGGGFKVNA